jgi:hypothetical protein
LNKLESAERSLGFANQEFLDQRSRLEFRIQEFDKQILEAMVEKELLEHKINNLEVKFRILFDFFEVFFV